MPSPHVSDKIKVQIAKLLGRGLTVSEVARKLGVDRGTVRRYRPDQPAKPADPIREAEEQIAKRRELLKEREALRDVAGERSFRAYLNALVQSVAPRLTAPPKYKPIKADRKATEESLLLLLSDWHAYERVKPERVLGLNNYDAETCGRRVYQVGQAALSIREKLTRGGWHLPRLVVACNGDFISGTIHEVERHQDAPNVIAAAFGAGMLLAQLLRDLSAGFERVTVFGTSGNHGRLPDARKVQQKDPTRSWDYLIYLFARSALADVPRVEFVLPESYSVVYEVEGWRFCQSHGHDIRSWQNIPFYGISRAATGINALRSAMGLPIHYFLYSHFHNPGSIAAAGGEYFVNGSLIGGTEYSVNGLGRADKPCQWMFGVHKDHGVTHRWPLVAGGDGPGGYDVRAWEGASR